MPGLSDKSVLDRIEALFTGNTPTIISAAIAAVKAVVDINAAHGTTVSARVHPTLAAAVVVTGDAGPQTLGVFATIVAAAAIPTVSYFDGIDVTVSVAAALYEVVLYQGAADTEFARFTVGAPGTYRLRASSRIPAGVQIRAKAASLAGTSQTLSLKIQYHL